MLHKLSLKSANTLCRVALLRTLRFSDICSKCLRKRLVYASYSVSARTRTHHLQVKINKKLIGQQRMRYLSTNVSETGSQQPSSRLFPLQFIYVRTSIALWVEFPDGLQFDVGFADTKMRTDVSISNSKPVILGLPSTAGDHSELTSVLMTFAKLGYRVVIPNLPVNSFCQGKDKIDESVFQMSVKEKAEFITDFLRELKIEKVHMLITSSCSVYTGVELCVINPTLFQSIVMINPTGLDPTKSMLPLRVHRYFTKVFDDRLVLQGLLKKCAAAVKRFTKKKDWETNNAVTYSRTIAVLSYADEKIRAEILKGRRIPRYAIFGENNDYLDVRSTMEYLSSMGVPESSITEIDGENNIVKKGEPFNSNYGLHIKGNSDDIKLTRTVLIRRELLKIIQKICPDL